MSILWRGSGTISLLLAALETRPALEKWGTGPVGATRKKDIGNLLKMAREIRRLTAGEVGKRCNVTRGRVYQWEKEKFVLPKNLPALAAALKVPLEMLEAENGRRPPLKKELAV